LGDLFSVSKVPDGPSNSFGGNLKIWLAKSDIAVPGDLQTRGVIETVVALIACQNHIRIGLRGKGEGTRLVFGSPAERD
jgi:hypothetical protein